MPVTEWLDRQQRRHPVLGFPLALVYKFLDDQGAYLAALITYYAFLSIFPLFLLLSSVLGFALENNPEWQTRILDSAVAQVPVIGQQIQREQLQGSTLAVAVGLAGAVYGALGVAQAIQHTMNSAWAVPRNNRPNPLMARVRSLGLLSVVGLATVASTVLSQLPAALASYGIELALGAQLLTMVGSYVISVALFLSVHRIGLARHVPVRGLLPGAILGALLWQILQAVGGTFVRTFVARGSALYGVFAIVLGLIAWLYFAAMAIVLSTEVNVVLVKKLFPRSLLTPLTDDVDLTAADQRAYTGRVRGERLKGFQHVDVSFEHDGQVASARRRRIREKKAERAAQSAQGVSSPETGTAGVQPDRNRRPAG